MGTVKDFEDLKIWQMARELCKDIFRITCYELFVKDYKLNKSEFKGTKFK